MPNNCSILYRYRKREVYYGIFNYYFYYYFNNDSKY